MSDSQNVSDARGRLADLRNAINSLDSPHEHSTVMDAFDDLETELENYVFEDANRLDEIKELIVDANNLAEDLKEKLEEI